LELAWIDKGPILKTQKQRLLQQFICLERKSEICSPYSTGLIAIVQGAGEPSSGQRKNPSFELTKWLGDEARKLSPLPTSIYMNISRSGGDYK
jgi:hypothetical protein